jgi:hypothetical protein
MILPGTLLILLHGMNMQIQLGQQLVAKCSQQEVLVIFICLFRRKAQELICNKSHSRQETLRLVDTL